MKDLKQQRVWACVRLSKKEDGRINKVPTTTEGVTTGPDEKHASDWVSYEEAAEAAKRNGYGAVCFAVPEGYFFLDIDHRDLSDPLVEKILDRFNTYAETSISGEGIHVYGKCDMSKIPVDKDEEGKIRLNEKYYYKNSKDGIELYIGGITNKFATVTENVIKDMPMEDCTDAVLMTLEDCLRRPDKTEETGTGVQKKRRKDLSDSEIVSSLREQANGDKFSALYDKGDTSDYGSPSEADAALCAMIAFRTGPDPDAIDRIFRSSALYRDKWEREDYRKNTIQGGIDVCHGRFHYSTKEQPYFVRSDKKSGKQYVEPARLARYVREHMDFVLLEEDGKQGGKQSRIKILYDDEAGVYRMCSDNMFIGHIKKFIDDYDEDLVKMSTLNEVLQQINTDLKCVKEEDLNDDEDLINFQNGLLRVTSDELTLMPHTPKVLSTIQIPCNWTGKPSPTPEFDRYMHTLTDGNAEVEELLLEFMGACISNVKGYRMKKSLFMVGPGDSGKSQLRSLTERLIGKENCMSADLKEIEERFGAGFIYGTRMAGTGDMSFMTVAELKAFKKITGGDSLMAEFKGRQPFGYSYNGLLWFCMNRLPRFGGDDGDWVYNRILTVYCPNSIPKDDQDKHLLDKMYAERDGIVYKAVRALQTVIKHKYNFSEPKAVTESRKRYMEENDSVISFFLECMEPWPDKKVNTYCTTGSIFRVYQAWCNVYNNGHPKTMKEFQDTLSSYIGVSYKDMVTRIHGNSYFKDYGLKVQAKEEFIRAYGKPNDPDLENFLR